MYQSTPSWMPLRYSRGAFGKTELLFDSLVREDRSFFDLFTADYTFVNERLARHYGLPNVAGPAFRRVRLTDDRRRGLFGHGSSPPCSRRWPTAHRRCCGASG